MKNPTILKQFGIVTLLPLLLLLGNLAILHTVEPLPAQAANIEDTDVDTFRYGNLQGEACDCSGGDTLSCVSFASRQEAQACYDYCQSTVGTDVHGLDSDGDHRACESRPNDPTYGQTETVTQTEESVSTSSPSPEAPIIPEEDEPQAVSLDTITLVRNGNFEFGFYQVPELGFEPRDSGDVPIDFGWYRNQAYGKYTIRNNQGFGLQCPLDAAVAEDLAEMRAEEEASSGFGPVPDYVPLPAANALELNIQSTDQQDARIGVYQTVEVVPGQDYRFSMSGTIQTQSGATTLQSDDPDDPRQAPNHTIELSFDHTGGTDWQAIPFERRTIIEWREQKLEFKVSEDDSDIADILNFETTVRARSNKMTIFLTAWRKWANWRTTRFIIDCVALVPLSPNGVPASILQTVVLEDSTPIEAPSDGAQPAAIIEAADTEQPADTEAEAPAEEEAPAIIPPAGGILEDTSDSILVIVTSAIVILGLVAAGIWNMRR